MGTFWLSGISICVYEVNNQLAAPVGSPAIAQFLGPPCGGSWKTTTFALDRSRTGRMRSRQYAASCPLTTRRPQASG